MGQDECILIRPEEAEEIRGIPGVPHAHGSDATFAGWILVNEIERRLPEHRHFPVLCPIRARLSSSRKAKSSTQWRPFSIPQ